MSERTDLKIFIASSSELDAERKESVLILAELNKRFPDLHMEPILFEFDTSSGNNPGKMRIQDQINPLLIESDIVVVVFYSQVGKFTLEEFNLASKRGKKVFLYFKEGFQSDEPDKLKKYIELAEFKKAIEAEGSIRYQRFNTTMDYNGLLYKDIEKYIGEKYSYLKDLEESIISSSKQHLPLAPRPYIAHPYSLPKNFTGRIEEMNKLTEWFYLDKEPVFFIEAIGGMGKSSIACKWLQDRILPEPNQTEGIIWWSFYDQSFEDFIKHLFQYCIPEGDRKRLGLVDETTAVCSALSNHRFLIVMDGFERVLRGYSQMLSMYIQEEGLSKHKTDEIKEKWDSFQRTPVNPKTERFLKSICAGQTKALFTSRLYPSTLEGLGGITHIYLKGLSKTDTIKFFSSENIIGSQEEMIKAGSIYNFHPLMLKLLSTAIGRSITKDIQKAFKSNLIDQREPQKILLTSFNLLNNNEKSIVAKLSVFRRAFDFGAAKALFPDIENEQLEEVLFELNQLGFLFYQEQEKLFDFHPIIRSFLYDHLTTKENIHELAIDYFQNVPKKERIISLEDIHPVIEQFHHLVMAKKYSEAIEICKDKLYNILFYQLGEHDLWLTLLLELLSGNEKIIPTTIKKTDQAYVLALLGESFSKMGLLTKAKEYYLKALLINSEIQDFEMISRNLNDIAGYIYSESTNMTSSVLYIKKAISLVSETEYKYQLNCCNLYLANLYTYQSKFEECASEGDLINTSDFYYSKCIEYLKEDNHYSGISLTMNTYTWSCLNEFRVFKTQSSSSLIKAFEWVINGIEYAEEGRTKNYPLIRNFIHIYLNLSNLIIFFLKYKISIPLSKTKVHFYDQEFSNIQSSFAIEQDESTLISLCERLLSDAAVRTVKIKLEIESEILLAQSKLEWIKIYLNFNDVSGLFVVKQYLDKAKEMAEKFNNVIVITDIHLFCAELLIELKEKNIAAYSELYGEDAMGHIKKAKENSLDKSTIVDLFLPSDSDEFYKDIPEYEMLKRGLTKKERIENGYYVAWREADALERRL